MKICQYCKIELENTATKCPTCGSTTLKRKCDGCGTEYEGKFCPSCGLNAEQTLKTCPECQTKYYTNACPNCGYVSVHHVQPAVDKSNTGKKIKPIIFVIPLCVIVVALFFVFSAQNDHTQSVQPTVVINTEIATQEPEPFTTIAPAKAAETDQPLSDNGTQSLYGDDTYQIRQSISTVEEAVTWLNQTSQPYADFGGHDVSGYPGIIVSQNSQYLIRHKIFSASQMTQMAAWLLSDDIPDISVIIRLPYLDYCWNELLCIPKDGGYDIYDIVKMVQKTSNKAHADTPEFIHLNDLSEVADLYYDGTSEIAQCTDLDTWIVAWRNPDNHDREAIFLNRDQLNIIKSAKESVVEKCPAEAGRQALIQISNLLGVDIKIP